ncbi:MAG TPA: uroporphyrinogen-III synthase [Allosphingosinicella sp.]
MLILRPKPGADQSAARARALGLEPVVAPLFTVRPLAWDVPEGAFDALLLTSANGARFGLRPELCGLLCYAVGEATAQAARASGASQVVAGSSDGAAAVALMTEAGATRALHLCGREHLPLSHPDIAIERRIVYAAEGETALPPEAVEALAANALSLLHSPRAAALFSSLVGNRGALRIAAISQAAADAAGLGWASVHVAEQPRDQALLELAARLCKTDAW